MADGDDSERHWVHMVREALHQAQATSLANQFILMEVVRMLARTSADPHRTVAAMFDAVTSRMDQMPLEEQGHPVHAEMVHAVDTFFRVAGQGPGSMVRDGPSTWPLQASCSPAANFVIGIGLPVDGGFTAY